MAAAKTVGILPFLFDKSDLFANRYRQFHELDSKLREHFPSFSGFMLYFSLIALK